MKVIKKNQSKMIKTICLANSYACRDTVLYYKKHEL